MTSVPPTSLRTMTAGTDGSFATERGRAGYDNLPQEAPQAFAQAIIDVADQR